MAQIFVPGTDGRESEVVTDDRPFPVNVKNSLTDVDGRWFVRPLTNKVVSQAKTRPANTTAYTAGDVYSESASVGTPFIFDVAKEFGGSGAIIRANITDDDTAHTQSFILLLFSVTPTGNLDDNGANTEPLTGTEDNFIGAIEFDALVDQGTGFSYATATPGNSKLPLPFVCESSDTRIYGVLTTSAFTPTSAEVVRVIIQVVQD